MSFQRAVLSQQIAFESRKESHKKRRNGEIKVVCVKNQFLKVKHVEVIFKT